jgi:hypothetical protein
VRGEKVTRYAERYVTRIRMLLKVEDETGEDTRRPRASAVGASHLPRESR